MAENRENPKYRIEVWMSILCQLHSCLGLNREGDHHPQCKEILEALLKDIEEVKNSL